MTTTYRTAEVEAKGDAGVVVVHCSDPRFQAHFQDFLANGLWLRQYALIAVPGGAQFLTLVEYLPKFSWAGWRWMKFVVDLSRPERIILIAHEDCRWYLDGRFSHEAGRIRERQIADLQRVRGSIHERFGQRRVELYYARLDASHALFDSV